MASLTNPFLRMAARVQQGSPNADSRFRSEMDPQIQRLIRRALRVGLSETPLCRRIKREAQRMGTDWRLLNPDDAVMMKQLAQRICQGVAIVLQNNAPTNSASDTTTGACVAETTVV